MWEAAGGDPNVLHRVATKCNLLSRANNVGDGKRSITHNTVLEKAGELEKRV